jgi:hypothetical protein
MNIGEIIKIEGNLATVRLGPDRVVYFSPSHKSVTHGHVFKVGDWISLRFSADNSRVASVVLADIP